MRMCVYVSCVCVCVYVSCVCVVFVSCACIVCVCVLCEIVKRNLPKVKRQDDISYRSCFTDSKLKAVCHAMHL